MDSNVDENREKKQNLGQFYTTNYEHILQNMQIPQSVSKIVEPFAGNCDLLKFLSGNREVVCYDIDPKNSHTLRRDTLLDPPNLDNCFILTNPPYLARNKCRDKEIFDKYSENDLYKCFIKILINCDCEGGILILPINFFCSVRKSDKVLREKFVKKYHITVVNIFEEQVFDDTTASVCCFQFSRKTSGSLETVGWIYPGGKKIKFILDGSNNYTIGGEIYDLPQSDVYNISRATKLNNDCDGITNILLKCIDNNAGEKIKLSIVSSESIEKYTDNTPGLTNRTYAILVITPVLDLEKQAKLVDTFNEFLDSRRIQFNSLFLSNYRESKEGFSRKRISFKMAYEVCSHLLKSL
jgi:hypothetical protein